MAELQQRTAPARRWTARLSLASIDSSRRSAYVHEREYADVRQQCQVIEVEQTSCELVKRAIGP